MQFTSAIAIAILSFAASGAAHGVITEIQGANGVNMPGLSVQDGTPRDCATPKCGSEADTSIIRKNGASPLGKTNGGGPVSAATMVAKFMGSSDGAATTGATGATAGAGETAATGATGATAKASGAKAAGAKAANKRGLSIRGLLDALTGGAGKGAAGGAAGGADAQGTKTPQGTKETGVSKAAGAGASSGMPTADSSGVISMTFHQVNQDGAGPLTAAIDATSGGTDESAFQTAQVTQNVPGAIAGLSAATTMDFPVKVQMPQGMVCKGTVAGVQNVCVAKLQNSALAGPFGGSVAFTQDAAGVKRAEEYLRLKARHIARGTLNKE